MNGRPEGEEAGAARNGGKRVTKVWRLASEHAGRNERGKASVEDADTGYENDPFSAAGDDALALKEAGAVLAGGGTVAFPTETVYGLGADARNTEAVENIFRAKGRPSDNPLIVHISDPSQLESIVVRVNEVERRLMETFWPGPLTLVLPVKPGAVSTRVTAGLDTVAVRMPAHPAALALIEAAGCPLAAPSANRSGRPSPTLAAHVLEDLSGAIDGVLDGGPAGVGVESTVVQAGQDGAVTVLRPGGVTEEQLAAVTASVRRDPALMRAGHADSPAPRSPGMKYTHYAPKGALCVVQGRTAEAVSALIQAELDAAAARGEKTGVLSFDEHIGQYRADVAFSLGSLAAPEEAARRLYAGLRRFDEEDATFLLAEACPEEGLGAAVMNRLLKAAGHHVLDADQLV